MILPLTCELSPSPELSVTIANNLLISASETMNQVRDVVTFQGLFLHSGMRGVFSYQIP